MKKLIFTLSALFTAFALQAAIITVSNNAKIPAQFTDLPTAVEKASEGDTIYIHGSTESYGNVEITKRLVLIGAGYAPQNANNHKSILGTVTFKYNETLLQDGSGSVLKGVEAYRIYGTATDVSVSRCHITSLIQPDAEGWMIYNNLIYIVEYLHANCKVYNNIITGALEQTYSDKVIVSNNLFIGSGNALYDVKNVIFTNNIYFGKNPLGSYTDYNSFTNNSSFGNDNSSFIVGTNTGGDNYPKVNPLFTKTGSTAFEWDAVYTLQESSPIFGKGIGIHAGQYPWPMKADGSMDFTGMPPMPHIVEMQLLNAAIPVGGSLKVHIKAKSQN